MTGTHSEINDVLVMNIISLPVDGMEYFYNLMVTLIGLVVEKANMPLKFFLWKISFSIIPMKKKSVQRYKAWRVIILFPP